MLTLRLLSGADSLRPLLDAARSGHEAPGMPHASHAGAPCACWHAGCPQAVQRRRCWLGRSEPTSGRGASKRVHTRVHRGWALGREWWGGP